MAYADGYGKQCISPSPDPSRKQEGGFIPSNHNIQHTITLAFTLTNHSKKNSKQSPSCPAGGVGGGRELPR